MKMPAAVIQGGKPPIGFSERPLLPSPEDIRLALRPACSEQPDALRSQTIIWDVYLGNRVVGYSGIEFNPVEFDAHLRRFGPAFRLCITQAFRGKGIGTAVARKMLGKLRDYARPLLSAHAAGDVAAARVLGNLGFLYTGCHVIDGNGVLQRQMITLP